MSEYAIFYDWAHPRAGVPTILLVALGVTVTAAVLYSAWTDIRSMLIMNYVTLPLIAGGLTAAPFLWEDWATHLIIAGVFGTMLFGFAFVKMRGSYMFGMGDAKLYLAAALILGLGFIPCLLISCITSLAHAAIIQRSMHGKLIMGPHIAFAIIVMLIVGAVAG